ncbi:MAG: murein biosynthesis integral membrane protein MurJ [Chloroflexi bacterium]|nr:murein biosynthesis integral membrane protein MurJ [Chloroflexota bacterium]
MIDPAKSTSSGKGVARAATTIMLGNVASRLLGVVRDQTIAFFFGLSGVTSAFVVAQTVPLLLHELIVGGLISAALVPVLAGYAGDEREFGRAVSAILGLATLVLGIAIVALVALARPVTLLLGAGLPEPAFELAVELLRTALVSLLFLGLAGVATGALYAGQIYTYPAFSPAIFNLGIIVAVVTLTAPLGPQSLAVGLVVGGALQLVIQAIGLRRIAIRPRLDLSHPAVRRVLELYPPVLMGLLIAQLGVVVDRQLASRTGEEGLAIMRFATTIVQFPIGLVVTATSFAVLPPLSRAAVAMTAATGAQEARAEYRRVLALGLRLSLFLMLPATVGLILLREPLVRFLFERGAFDAQATQQTALAFLVYAPQLPFVAIDQILIFAYYARQDTRTPNLVGVASVACYLLAALALLNPYGVYGLVAANTVQNAVHGLIMLGLVWRYLGWPGSPSGMGSPGSPAFLVALAKILVATAAMGLGLLALTPILNPLATPLRLLAGVAIGAAIYLTVGIGLRSAELRLVFDLVRESVSRARG